jgi:hypothetical protein
MDFLTTMVIKSPSSKNPPPVTDLSARAVKLARIIDRLPEGSYHIALIKNAQGWALIIEETNQVRSGLL